MLSNRHNFTFTGSNLKITEYSPSGKDGFQCFHSFESEGKLITTRHKNIFETLLRVKASLNFQIKEWAHDRASGLLPKIEFNKIIHEFNLPEWVVRAVENQKCKYYQ